MGATTGIKKYYTEKTETITLSRGEEKEVVMVTCGHCKYTFRKRVENPKRCGNCQKDLWNWRELIVSALNDAGITPDSEESL